MSSIEINTILKLPKNFNLKKIKKGSKHHIVKQGERFIPINKPLEFCDYNYRYIGKLMIYSLTLVKNKTIIDFKVLKVFSKEESDVFSKAFIKQKN
ncbi:MAG: DUF2584 family protein [Candidatus Levybacteria bacterium]|nr:DUF2584 family protein [Candidatus Levybacteria bacterium]